MNIENAYHDLLDDKENYESFDGIVLTDTFQMGETDDNEKLFSEMFPQNSERVQRQKKAPLRVIIGNPPYSIGQKSANDNAQNQKYEKLDERIAETYAYQSEAGLSKSLYDAYIKAFRWSTDRLDPQNGGVISFVSNGKWLDANSTDGFRKMIEDEFSSIYVFDLRGDQRGDWRKEGGKIFGEGSQNRISISFFVKKPNAKSKASIYYYDIGDYLSRDDKLKIIGEYKSIANNSMKWKKLKPNEHGDWLNKRNALFETYIPVEPEKKFDADSKSFFATYAIGVSSNRDPWVYNYSEKEIVKNMQRLINCYNTQIIEYVNAKKQDPDLSVEDFVDTDPKKIKWTRSLRNDAAKGVKHDLMIDEIINSLYRPFIKQRLYFHKSFIESPGLSSRFFPDKETKNLVMIVTGIGASKDFSVLMADSITGLDTVEKSQCFPLYYYEEAKDNGPGLFDDVKEHRVRKEGISNYILDLAIKAYGKNISKEDIFYYVYGILHSSDYRSEFANDLKKMLPHIPLVDDVRDFWKFCKAGRKLADLHINYEDVPPYEGVVVSGADSGFYRVEKMRFPKKNQKDVIIYNSKIVVSNIPEKAYEYIVNGKSAIEWIMERYQITIDKGTKNKPGSMIKNDPNDWAVEVSNPRYILDLLLSIINVSVQTVNIVNELPKLEFKDAE